MKPKDVLHSNKNASFINYFEQTSWAFLGRFTLLVLLSYGLLAIPAVDRLLYEVLKATAWVAGLLLNFFGDTSKVDGVVIHTKEFTVGVRRGCDGVEPMLVLWSAMVAAWLPLRPMLLGLVVSGILIQILNLLRVVSLSMIGARWPSAFHIIHVEIWPIFFIIAGLCIFVTWIKWSRSFVHG